MLRTSLRRLPQFAKRLLQVSQRDLNLHEYQCKKLMSDFDINVQRFMMVKNQSDIDAVRTQFKVMVAEALDIERETYLAILMDREAGAPTIVACKQGGMEIEDLAKDCPEAILRDPIDINAGVTEKQANRVATFLGFTEGSPQHKQASEQICRLYKMFGALDCLQVEINPFGLTPDGQVVSFDAKLMFDQNAVYRHPEIVKMAGEVEAVEVAAAGPTSTVALEADATRHGLNYIGLADGNIGCVVNGAGLAMATMDLIHFNGGKPANFLDLGGGVSERTAEHAFRLLTSDPRLECILVNIFGGIVNCNTVAKGLINAFKQMAVSVPVVVRLEGTNAAEARQTLADSNLGLYPAATLQEAASLAVAKTKAKLRTVS